MAVWPIPAVIDWKIALFVLILATWVMALQATPIISADMTEWGLGAGILGAILAPFGASITVLALFAYQSGDMGPGWEQSWSVIPALVLQLVALIMVITGLVLQRKDRSPLAILGGRWTVIAGTMLGASAVVAHLIAVAHDVA
jgi:hypothetical protein